MDRACASLHALMTLADGRFPAGGHVHSAGIEAAVADGRVGDLGSVHEFTAGRLRTTGLADAALTAATVHRLASLDGPVAGGGVAVLGRPAASDRRVVDLFAVLDAEAAARCPPPGLRDAARRSGRQLVRAAGRCWPHPHLTALGAARPAGALLPVALGAVAHAAGLAPGAAARLSLHHAITTPTQAAVRLLGLDPFEVAALGVRLAGVADEMAGIALRAASGPLDDLPAGGGPVVEIAAVEHAGWDLRLFAT